MVDSLPSPAGGIKLVKNPFELDEPTTPEFKPDVPKLVTLSSESKESANLAFASGSYERASELYLRAMRRLEDVDLDAHADARSLTITLLLNLSLCRLRMDEPRRALNAANRALEIEPKSEKGLYRRASAAMRLHEYGRADDDLTAL